MQVRVQIPLKTKRKKTPGWPPKQVKVVPPTEKRVIEIDSRQLGRNRIPFLSIRVT